MINEMIPDWIYDLVKKSKPVTEEVLSQLNKKEFSSGKLIKVGDILLYGLELDVISQGEIKINLISFSPDEIGSLYIKDESPIGSRMPLQKIPYLKKINKQIN